MIHDMQHSFGDTLVTSLDKSPEVLRDQKFQAVIAGTPAASELFGTSRTNWIKTSWARDSDWDVLRGDISNLL